MELFYTDQSRNDIHYAIEWYNKQKEGLGLEFLDCVEAALNRIIRNPKMYEMVYDNIRRCVIRKFPFAIFYSIEGSQIIIHSVFDNRQAPGKRP